MYARLGVTVRQNGSTTAILFIFFSTTNHIYIILDISYHFALTVFSVCCDVDVPETAILAREPNARLPVCSSLLFCVFSTRDRRFAYTTIGDDVDRDGDDGNDDDDDDNDCDNDDWYAHTKPTSTKTRW